MIAVVEFMYNSCVNEANSSIISRINSLVSFH